MGIVVKTWAALCNESLFSFPWLAKAILARIKAWSNPEWKDRNYISI